MNESIFCKNVKKIDKVRSVFFSCKEGTLAVYYTSPQSFKDSFPIRWP